MTELSDVSIQVLICTANERLASAIRVALPYKPGVSYLISHQIFGEHECDFIQEMDFINSRIDIEYYPTYSKGLSINRNNALSMASSEIILIADDDVVLESDFDQTLRCQFLRHPDADIITFKVRTPEGHSFKSYREKEFKHGRFSLLKVSSIEVAFKRKTVMDTALTFDENFGLGARFVASEENVFLMDAFKKGLNLYFVPLYVACHPKESSGKQWREELVYSKGALFFRLFGFFGIVMIFAFAIKKYGQYKDEFTFIEFIRLSLSSFGGSER